MSLRIVIICAICLMMLSIANAESVSLPLNVVKKPANDLIYANGQAVDAGQAAALARKGEDLSQFNPADNKFWQNRTYSATDTVSLNYPAGPQGVRFLSEEAVLPGIYTYMALVQSNENPQAYFRLSLSRYSHTTLMRAAFLRKLGYYVPSPKYYRNLRLKFASEEQKEEFIHNAESSMIVDMEDRGWILENNKEDHSLVFADALLEVTSNDYFDLYWGNAPNPNNPAQLPLVQRYSKFRAYRALIVPFAMVDLPESVNRFSPKFASVLSAHVVINHPAANSFSSCTYEDARWILRRLQNFTKADFAEVVQAGEFPPELNELILTKLLYRASNALEIFSLPSKLGPLPALDINSPSGLVRGGKVTQERIQGYPQRFAHGDRESPFQDGDLGRYFSIRGKATAIGTALNQLNKQLEILSTSDAVSRRRTEIQDRISKHIKEKPFEPLYQDIEAWGGPLAGFNVAANRSVSTGTYYGSTAAIQLVDTLTVAGQLGYFMTLDGAPRISPLAGANVMVSRDYTHVRPLLSIQEGSKVSWKNLVIPVFMKNLSRVLSEEKNKEKDSLDTFLADLREGEVFTITDSVVLGTYTQVGSAFDTLLGITPLNFMNTVALGADASRVILRQTSIMRTPEGLQIFVRSQKNSIFGLSLDANYFINILRIRASTNVADLRTDAFVIDYDPELGALIDSGRLDNKYVTDFLDTKKSLRPTLQALFTDNNTDLLYSKFAFKKFEIDHQLKTKEIRSKLLASRISQLNEEHLLKIRYPRNPEAPELDPKNEEVTLFAKKRGELVGRDLLGFAMDWIEGILNKWMGSARVALNASQDPNPANAPFGKAYWRLVTTESDLSVNNVQYPSVAVLQHVWGGWHLNRKDFMKLLDEVQGQLKGTQISSYRLIEPEAFSTTSAIDFYRVTASLSVLPGGLEVIRDLLLQPDAAGKTVPRAKFLGRLFQKLSEKLGNKARPQEKEMFDDLMKILGNGDAKAGLAHYNRECRQEKRNAQGESSVAEYTGTWWNGINYECLTHWVTELMALSAKYPQGKQSQTRWLTDVLYILDKQIPLPQLLKLLGEENYVFVVRINGFRTGDEDGDLEYFSNTLGDPRENLEYANGLIQMFATKTRISPLELDRTQGGFR